MSKSDKEFNEMFNQFSSVLLPVLDQTRSLHIPKYDKSNKINASQEFDEHINLIFVKENTKVKCVKIKCEKNTYLPSSRADAILPCFFTKEEYDNFMQSLNFEYDSGYGSQELFGTIWYENGTWSSRYEYDGKEGWKYNSQPTIPDILIKKDRERNIKITQIIE